mmetsp:Transcript_72711/g.193966  ORF Transcript_72711/g.193966 Transcript_72711/m.193966 type:complete len:296 (-) Transcript_72711:949-1836(-)
MATADRPVLPWRHLTLVRQTWSGLASCTVLRPVIRLTLMLVENHPPPVPSPKPAGSRAISPGAPGAIVTAPPRPRRRPCRRCRRGSLRRAPPRRRLCRGRFFSLGLLRPTPPPAGGRSTCRFRRDGGRLGRPQACGRRPHSGGLGGLRGPLGGGPGCGRGRGCGCRCGGGCRGGAGGGYRGPIRALLVRPRGECRHPRQSSHNLVPHPSHRLSHNRNQPGSARELQQYPGARGCRSKDNQHQAEPHKRPRPESAAVHLNCSVRALQQAALLGVCFAGLFARYVRLIGSSRTPHLV